MSIPEDQLEKLKRAYQILGVPLFASALSIKQAYRQLVKRWHPDRYPSGSSSHAEASQMIKLINQAYSEIEHAPLRYYSGDKPRVQQRVKSTYPLASDTPDAARQAVPKTDRLEFWVRFVCGSLLGLFVSFRLILYVADSPSILIAGVVGAMFGCGYAAARYGDRFWYSILRHWWFWS
jgi:hypothetical protein